MQTVGSPRDRVKINPSTAHHLKSVCYGQLHQTPVRRTHTGTHIEKIWRVIET